jgi:rfaE bifunctional protein kinase chain/domain
VGTTPFPDYDADQIVAEIRRRKNGRKRVVFVSGNFNIIHPGHLRLLRFAADCGDFLVVGVHDDAHPGVLVPAELRYEGIKSVSWIHHAFVMREPAESFIAKLKPAVVVKGREYEKKVNPEAKVVRDYGGKLIFGSGDVRFSSLDLIKQEIEQIPSSSLIKPDDFPQRHGFALKDLARAVGRFSGLRVCVIGDTIVDEYITCDALGMSQEEPTLVVAPVSHERFIGGAAIVASHAHSLGAEVTFCSVVGDDATAAFVKEKLAHYGVTTALLTDESRPTTLKQRYRAAGRTLLRVSHLRSHAIEQAMVDQILDRLLPVMDRCDLLVFSDFNYGCLSQPLVDALTSHGTQRRKLMAADSQSSSQTGDISRFRGMSLVTPTEREARLAVRDFNSGLVVMAESLRQRSQARNIIVTLGGEGLIIHASNDDETQWTTDRLPAFNSSPKDVAGAGDSLLTCASMGLAVGCDIWQSAYLGSLAAACQVGRVGNIPLRAEELLSELDDGALGALPVRRAAVAR